MTEHAAVSVENVTCSLGGAEILRSLDLEVRAGEFFSVLGPSGCGKTTLLRIINGLVPHASGTIRILGRDVSDVPAHKRPVHTVFQSYALFPHMSVKDNIAFGLRMRQAPRSTIERRVSEMTALVGLDGMADRRPAQLSGGQQQRVALARALAPGPSVLLLDEPMGALDVRLKRDIQTELKTWQRKLGATFVYVTHDQEEAMSLSDRVVVMRGGRVEQIGTPDDVYNRPTSRFVADFLGSCNFISGRWTSEGGQVSGLDCSFGHISLTHLPKRPRLAASDMCLAIRPERIQLQEFTSDESPAHGLALSAMVEDLTFRGPNTEIRLRVGSTYLIALAARHTVERLRLEPARQVNVVLPGEALLFLEK